MKQNLPVTKKSHRGIGLKAAVQQIAGYIELSAVFQQENARVNVSHSFQQIRLDRIPIFPLGTVALIASGGGIGVDPDVLPEGDEGGEHTFIPGEVLVEIVRHRAVEHGLVPLPLIEAVGIADHTVIGHGLGGLKHGIEPHADLLQGIVCTAFQLLP